jgi:hypothetical protein
VLFDAGASHMPQGGLEATNEFPHITNPSGKLSLCKHLVALGAYLQMTQREFKRWQKDRADMQRRGETPSDNPMLPPVIKPDSDTEEA